MACTQTSGTAATIARNGALPKDRYHSVDIDQFIELFHIEGKVFVHKWKHGLTSKPDQIRGFFRRFVIAPCSPRAAQFGE